MTTSHARGRFFIIYPRKDNPMNTPAFLKNLLATIDKPIHQAYNLTENQYKLYTPETLTKIPRKSPTSKVVGIQAVERKRNRIRNEKTQSL